MRPDEPAFLSALQSQLLQTTSHAQELPSKASDLAFHRSVDQKLAVKLDSASGKVWGLIDSLLGLIGEEGGKGKRKREEDDLVDEFEDVVVRAGLDGLLEKADSCLDTFLGRLPAPSIPIIPTETARSRGSPIVLSSNPKARLPSAILNANIPKPQLQFHQPPPSSSFPFYHSSFSLNHSYTPEELAALPYKDVAPHPYTPSLLHPSFPDTLLAPTPKTELTQPASFQDTPFEFVDSPEAMSALVSRLEGEAKVLAVDLEHHSFRSFDGFLCLMQLTARDQHGNVLGDWVVDLLVPEVRDVVRAEMGKVLANPEIVKVFHGAESDIVWLQQNFDLYVVNLFDTYHATCVLDFPHHSLLSLLEKYCSFTPDKRYQLADWRIRPLPLDMLTYARSDTHYLLYIYDSLLNALLLHPSPSLSEPSSFPTLTLEKTYQFPATTPPSLQIVLTRSTQTALKRFTPESYSTDGAGSQGYATLAKKYNKLHLLPPIPAFANLDTVQESVAFRRVHEWRDRVAREEDESTRYVLANHLIVLLADKRPKSAKEIAGLGARFSEVMKRRAEELVGVLKEAEEEAERVFEMRKSDGQGVEVEVENVGEREFRESRDREGRKSEVVLSLWDLSAPTKPNLTRPTTTTAQSTLFGRSLGQSLTPQPTTTRPTAQLSSLFGTTLPAPSVKSSTAPAADFSKVLARIHSSINPPPPPPTAVDPALSVQATLPGVEQVPYVPSSERTTSAPAPPAPTKEEEKEKDTIVTVGKARSKRRKVMRTKEVQGEGEGEGAEPMDVTKEVEEEEKKVVEPFDYSAVPNGLDVPKGNKGAFGGKKLKKAKKEKKPIVEYGDFKKPPQSMAENKKGNRSHTFS